MSQILLLTADSTLLQALRENLQDRYCCHHLSVLPVALSSQTQVTLVDARLIDPNMRQLKRLMRPGARIVLIGDRWPKIKQVQAFAAGCQGYCEREQIALCANKAIDLVLSGDYWLPRNLVPLIIDWLVATRRHMTSSEQAVTDENPLTGLSPRELDVAHLVGQGESNKLIASTLKISERTVKAHLTSIFQKLEVHDRLQLALMMQRHSSAQSIPPATDEGADPTR